MEEYILEISKYFFKDALNNSVIQKVLLKKEEKFHIQEKVVNELNDLKELVLELVKLDFDNNNIQKSIDNFIKDSEYLSKVSNFNIDLELITSSVSNSEPNESSNMLISQNQNSSENREIIPINNLSIIDEDKIEIIPNVIIDKYFEDNFLFEYICSLYLDTFINMRDVICKKTNFNSVANGQFENVINKNIQTLKNSLMNIIPDDNNPNVLDKQFYEFLIKISNITKIAREERGNINSNISQFKNLQKLSRSSESSLFVGNAYAMGAFALFKGAKSVFNSISDASERNDLRNSMEANFMQEFYNYIEENFENDLLNTMPVVVNTIFGMLTLRFPEVKFKSFNELIDAKNKFQSEYNSIPENVTKADSSIIKSLLSIYPYSTEIWFKFFEVISVDEFLLLEENLKRNSYSHTLEMLMQVKDKKILLESNDLELVYNSIKNSKDNKSIIKIFEERFGEKIYQEDLTIFIDLTEYTLNKNKISVSISNKEKIIINVLKEAFYNNLDLYFESNKIDILLYRRDIIDLFYSIIFKTFFPAKNIINFLNNKYNDFIASLKFDKNQTIIDIQNSINKDLEITRNILLAERKFMKYLVFFDYFKRNSNIQKLIKIAENIKTNNIHLNWNTNESAGIITLSSIFFISDECEYQIFISDITKVKVNELNIELGTKDDSYIIPIFDNNEWTEEKEESVKSLALYIKKLSKHWEGVSTDLKIYVNNDSDKIDNMFSKPKYVLEYIFNNTLKTEGILRIFLKNGIITEKDVVLRRNLFNHIVSNFQEYANATKKIEIYPFNQGKLDKIQNLAKSSLGKYIDSQILAVYYENEYFDKERSVVILTERSIVILTNSFGEIPLNIINNVSLTGFTRHNLEFETIRGNLNCLLDTNEDSNKILLKMIRELLRLKS